MRTELKSKGLIWLKSFPKSLNTLMEKFRKGQAEFHLIELVTQRDTNKLWMDQYPDFALKYLREETDFQDILDEINNEKGLGDDEKLTLESSNDEIIEWGLFDYINQEFDFPNLFDELKNQIKVGDIVYAPYYATRMAYGINIATLDENGDIILLEDEGHYPSVPKWQESIMRYNKLSFTDALCHITYEYGDWDSSDLLSMWE